MLLQVVKRLSRMSDEEVFSIFLSSLTPHILEQVVAHFLGDLSTTVIVAEHLALCCMSAWEIRGSVSVA